jgi:Uma2 family endonuclease
MASQSAPFVTPERYLELERAAETKSEYYRGEIFAMAGAKLAHTIIVTNLIAELRDQLRKRDCTAHSSDARLAVKSDGLYTYPDVMVICGKPAFIDAHLDTVTNPIVIIEVLSKSTSSYDRGQKFESYRAIPSLMEYLTVAQDRPHVEHWTRQPENSWLLREIDAGGSISLNCISVELHLNDIYEKVEFAAK